MSVYKQLAKAYSVGCPLATLECSDPAHAIKEIREAFGAFKERPNLISWDCVRGWFVFDKNVDIDNLKAADEYQGNPLELLADCAKLNADFRCVVILNNAHQFWGNFGVVQAIWNLRDVFKTGGKLLVLLSNGGRIPSELQHDIVALVDPLPNAEALSGIIGDVCKSAEVAITSEQVQAAGCAALGVTAFAAENLAALAIDKKTGLSLGGLWESKKKKINETPALQVVSGGSLEHIGGVKQAKKFFRQVLAGKGKPNAIVYIDEIEKALGAASSDSSGTSQDQVGTILSWMQDNRATGAILVGPPGAVKSQFSKAAGADAGIPTIQLDLGAAKGSLVGQSEKQIREALQVIHAVSGGKTLWLATCNSMTALPPELKRRFKLGTWYFDLPDQEERNDIWEIYRQRYGLETQQVKRLTSKQWTGAEIEQCCELASQLGIDPSESAEYIVPVAVQAADAIARLRDGADGRFLSASYPGVYSKDVKPQDKADTKRKFSA